MGLALIRGWALIRINTVCLKLGRRASSWVPNTSKHFFSNETIRNYAVEFIGF